MRKISLVLVTAMLLSTGSIFANDSKEVKPSKTLAAQIGELLKNNNFIIDESDLIATIRFTLNSDKEIVVLSVDTDNDLLEGFVKSRLNYHKVDLAEYNEGKMYTVPVRVTE